MKIFVTTHFDPKDHDSAIQLNRILSEMGVEPYSFVLSYPNTFSSPKLLMQTAKEEINKCDAVLFDATQKSTGRAIEVGIAYTLNKYVIVIAQKGTEIRDTLAGVANIVIEYTQIEDIKIPLTNFLLLIKSK